MEADEVSVQKSDITVCLFPVRDHEFLLEWIHRAKHHQHNNKGEQRNIC